MRLIQFFVLTLILLPVGACDHGFDALNTNPNQPTEVNPGQLLPYGVEGAMDAYLSASVGMEFANLVVQHWARIRYTTPDRYIWGDNIYTHLWSTYRSSLRDFAEVERLGRENDHPNYEAIGLILKSWNYSVLTDAYGDIPYSEALKGEEGVRFPKFDTQEAIYDSLLANLERASALIEVGGPGVSGDTIFQGDMAKWRAFANSLRLRLLLRISDRRDVGTDIQQLVNNEPLMAGNDDSAVLVYRGGTPNRNPFRELPGGRRNQFRISRTMVERLKEIDDPRLSVYADTTEYVSSSKPADSLYVGTPNGMTEEASSELDPAHRSKIGAYFRRAEAPGVFMSYAEVQFMLAEAAARGFIGDEAESHYRAGIEASFDQYGVVAADDYFSDPRVAYDEQTALQKIAEQKWIALYGQGFEAWFEWRRTGYPELTPAIDNANDDRIPERMRYPTTLQISNPDAYREAVDRQGSNNLDTRVWWDVEPNN